MINNYEFFNDCVYIMSALKKFGAKDIVVAGGAIRDTLLGKPVKDIDVFYTGAIELDDESDLAKHYGMKWKNSTEFDEIDSTMYEEEGITVTNTNLLFQDIPYPVQLIEVNGNSIQDIVNHIVAFPCGLSKAILHEEGTLSLANDFLQNEFFKIVAYEPGTSPKYKNKLVQKYPEFAHE